MIEIEFSNEKHNKISFPEKSAKPKMSRSKFNSLKSEKSTENSSNYKQYANTISSVKTKYSSSNTKLDSSSSINTNSAKSIKSSKVDIENAKFLNIPIFTPVVNNQNTPNSNLIEMSNYENIIPIIEIDFSDQIINLVDMILNFLMICIEEPNFVYNHHSNFETNKSNATEEDLESLTTNDTLSHSMKINSTNIDKAFIDNFTSNQKEFDVNKLDMFFHEMDSIYNVSTELNESVNLSQNSERLLNSDRKCDELGQPSTHVLLNIEMIKDYSEGRLSTYKKLLSSCNSNFKEISLMILSTMMRSKYERNCNKIISGSDNKINNSINETKINSDRTSLINQKMEMLRSLKEKKNQILNENLTRKISRKNTKTFKTLKTFSENDIDESYVNENVVVNNLPESNININKPSGDKMNFKNIFDAIELDEEIKSRFSHDESEMIINFQEVDEIPPFELENQTVNKTETEISNSHKRSRSEIELNLDRINGNEKMYILFLSEKEKSRL